MSAHSFSGIYSWLHADFYSVASRDLSRSSPGSVPAGCKPATGLQRLPLLSLCGRHHSAGQRAQPHGPSTSSAGGYLLTHSEDLSASEQEALNKRRQESKSDSEQKSGEDPQVPDAEKSKPSEERPQLPPEKESSIEQLIFDSARQK